MTKQKHPLSETLNLLEELSFKNQNEKTLWEESDIQKLVATVGLTPLIESETGDFDYWCHPDGFLFFVHHETQDVLISCVSSNQSLTWFLGSSDSEQEHTSSFLSSGVSVKLHVMSFKNQPNPYSINPKENQTYCEGIWPMSEWNGKILRNLEQEVNEWKDGEDLQRSFSSLGDTDNLDPKEISTFWAEELCCEDDQKILFDSQMERYVHRKLTEIFEDLFEDFEFKTNPNQAQREKIGEITKYLLDKDNKELNVAVGISPLTLLMNFATDSFEDLDLEMTESIQNKIAHFIKKHDEGKLLNILSTDSWWEESLKNFLIRKHDNFFPFFIREFKKEHHSIDEILPIFSWDLSDSENDNNRVLLLNLKAGRRINEKEEQSLRLFFKENKEFFLDEQNTPHDNFESLMRTMQFSQEHIAAKTSTSILQKEINEQKINYSLSNDKTRNPMKKGRF